MLSAHFTTEVEATIQRAIREAEYIENLNRKDSQPWRVPPLDFVLLAGQRTKIPALREIIRSESKATIITEHQDDAVLDGLTQQCGVLHGENHDQLLLDVFYRAIGVRLHRLRGDGQLYQDTFQLESDDKQNDSAVILLERGIMIRQGVQKL